APAAIALAWLAAVFRTPRLRAITSGPCLVIIVLAAIATVGCYALVKGEVSEKLALRYGLAMGPHQVVTHRGGQKLPSGLDDPRWDFSPKEETDRIPIRNWRYAVVRIIGTWWEELCWLFAVMAVWGVVRQRFIRGLSSERDPNDDAALESLLLLAFAAV